MSGAREQFRPLQSKHGPNLDPTAKAITGPVHAEGAGRPSVDDGKGRPHLDTARGPSHVTQSPLSLPWQVDDHPPFTEEKQTFKTGR